MREAVRRSLQAGFIVRTYYKVLPTDPNYLALRPEEIETLALELEADKLRTRYIKDGWIAEDVESLARRLESDLSGGEREDMEEDHEFLTQLQEDFARQRLGQNQSPPEVVTDGAQTIPSHVRTLLDDPSQWVPLKKDGS